MLSSVLLSRSDYTVAAASVATLGLSTGFLTSFALLRYSPVDPSGAPEPSTADYVSCHRLAFRVAGVMVPMFGIAHLGLGYTLYKLAGPFAWNNTRGLLAISLALGLFNTPFTFRYLLPLNSSIPKLASEKDPKNERRLRQMIEEWHKYHLIRCVYMLTSLGLAYYALVF